MENTITAIVKSDKRNIRLKHDLDAQLELFRKLNISEGLIFRFCVMVRPDGGYALVAREDSKDEDKNFVSQTTENVTRFTYGSKYSTFGKGREEDRLEQCCSVEEDEIRPFASF